MVMIYVPAKQSRAAARKRTPFLDRWYTSTMMVRVFVACEIPEEIRNLLGKVRTDLATSPSRLRFVDPDLFHITIKFIGEVDEKLLAQMYPIFCEIRGEPFMLSVDAVTADNPRHPRTIWARIVDSEGKCAGLAQRMEEAVSRFGIPKETRRFTPHATVARVAYADPGLAAAIAQLEQKTYGTFTVNGFVVKKSTLTPRGPVYENLLEVAW
jgi:2'-5' RNA ligase